jgi:hypothetical protein
MKPLLLLCGSPYCIRVHVQKKYLDMAKGPCNQNLEARDAG